MPASAATSGIVTSTRRGEATSRAPIAVIETRTTASTSACQGRRLSEHGQADQPEGDQRPVQSLPGGSRITSRGPCDQIRPSLPRRSPRRRSAARVMSRQSRSRPIRASALSLSTPGIALRRERGEDLLQPDLRRVRHRPVAGWCRYAVRARHAGARGWRTAWRVLRSEPARQPGVPFEHLAPDPFRVAAGGHVGAGEEHLAAAGRDGTKRSRAIRLRIVQGATTIATPASRTPACASAGAAPGAQRAGEDEERQPGRRSPGTPDAPSRSRPSSSPGPSHARAAPGRSAGAQRMASTEPASRVAPSGSVISIPLVLEQGRIDRDRRRRRSGRRPGPRGGGRSGRRRGPRAMPIRARTRRARRSCDAAAQLVEAAGQQRQPGRVVARGLGRALAEGEARRSRVEVARRCGRRRAASKTGARPSQA